MCVAVAIFDPSTIVQKILRKFYISRLRIKTDDGFGYNYFRWREVLFCIRRTEVLLPAVKKGKYLLFYE
jgi:hypothetical protein